MKLCRMSFLQKVDSRLDVVNKLDDIKSIVSFAKESMIGIVHFAQGPGTEVCHETMSGFRYVMDLVEDVLDGISQDVKELPQAK